ncbi:GNAT family N-acetyltransferase [Xylocopilactobacillus apis]|uniref:N-acetyltransferase n=1 Tax=Xylocopilactobacillus apis TaxID=2932183 RepID=A0AAU9D764_9LACO|nr:GNAT family N-acetyltransferase [Xylocopilactobacillus apis]BDR56612.1 N-acetyltransferase [Xylocopilactobacillus apis]
MIIRNAKVNDSEAIKDLCENELEYQTDLSLVKSQLSFITSHSDQQIIIVAEDNNLVVGFVHAQLYITLYSAPSLNILGLAVSKKYQKQGIGKTLMAKIESLALKNDIHQIRLNSGVERISAHRFYESVGYIHNKDQARYGKII